MHPILFRFPEAWPLIGDFPIRSFSVMVLIGVLVGAGWARRNLFRDQGDQADAQFDALLWRCLVFGFIGARLLYVTVHPEVLHGPLSLIAFWEGGLVSYGGFFGGAFGGLLFCRKFKLRYTAVSDVVLPSLCLGQVFGRIGCLLVGDDQGSPWDGPWAITFQAKPDSLIPPELFGVPLHPSQIYLSLMNVAIFVITASVLRKRRFIGQTTTLVMMLYAVGRFSIEFTRGDDAARGIYGMFSTSQWASLFTVAVAAFWYRRLSQKAVAPEATA